MFYQENAVQWTTKHSVCTEIFFSLGFSVYVLRGSEVEVPQPISHTMVKIVHPSRTLPSPSPSPHFPSSDGAGNAQ